MLIECSTCSRPGTERSNPQGEAREGESVSRNASELASASLCYSGSGQPVMVGETCHCRGRNIRHVRQTPRGGWRQRAETEWLRNLGDPQGLRMSVSGQRGLLWESEESIVVKQRRMPVERRDSTVSVQTIKAHEPA